MERKVTKEHEVNWEEQIEMVEDSWNPEVKEKFEKKYNDPLKNATDGLY